MGTNSWLSWALTLIIFLTLLGVYEQVWRGVTWRKEIHRLEAWASRRRLSRFGMPPAGSTATGPRMRRHVAAERIQRILPNLKMLGRDHSPSDLALMALEVSSRLRAGGSLTSAWEQTWRRNGKDRFQGIEMSGAPKNLLTAQSRNDGSKGERTRGKFTRSSDRLDLAESGSAAIVAACRFSFLSGAPLADVLEKVAEGLVQATRGREAQDRAFTGPKLAARVLTSLPFLAVVLGELLGLGSIAWFFAGGMGTAALVCGLTLSVMGHLVSQGMIARARERTKDEMEATILCDLAAAGLSAGASIPAVLKSLGRARGDKEWVRIAEELVMGSTWAEAWDPPPARARLLRRGLQVGWEEGVSPLILLTHLASESRERHVARAEEEAARLTVKLVIPLGLFLLPAFVFLGILPAIFALMSGESIL